MVVVFDLDGTLADIDHRLHHIEKQPKDWDAFYLDCPMDTPIHQTIQIAQWYLRDGHQVEVWTGRGEISKDLTDTWLRANGLGHISKLLMRRQGDKRPTAVVKQEWLKRLYPCERPSLVFEDSEDVVQMWNKNGVLCYQVVA